MATDYQAIFDASLTGEPIKQQPRSESDYSEFFDNVLKAVTNPVGEAGAYGLKQIKDALTPDTRTEGLQADETERSPNYPTSDMTNVSVSDTLNASAALSLGGAALRQLPKVNINMIPSEAPAGPPALPDPIKTNAIDTSLVGAEEPTATRGVAEYQKSFDVSVKTSAVEPGDYKGLFTTLIKDDRVAPSMEGNGPASRFIEPGALASSKATTDADVLKPEPKSSEDFQKLIDAKVDALMAEGKSFKEADNHPDVTELYKKRDTIDTKDLTDSFSSFQSKLVKLGSSEEEAKDILKSVYNIDPESQAGVYMAAKYGQPLLDNPEKASEEIFKHLYYGPNKDNPRVTNDVLIENRASPYTDEGRDKLLAGLKKKARKIAEALSTDKSEAKGPRELQTINPKDITDGKPYALFRGAGFGGDFYDIYNSPLNSESNVRVTLSGDNALEQMKKHDIPLVGLDPAAKGTKPSEPSPVASRSEAGEVTIPTKKSLENFADKFDISGQYNEIQHEKANYFGDLAAKQFTDQQAVSDVFKGMSPAEDRAFGYMAEKSPVPNPYLKDPRMAEVVKLIQNPSPAMLEALPKYQALMKAKAEELKLHTPDFDERVNYAPHILNYPILKERANQNVLSGATPFTRERVLENKADALNLGFTEKYPTTSEEIKAYVGSVNAAVAQKQFANTIAKMKDVNGEPFSYPKKIMNDKGKMVANTKLPTVVKDGADISSLLKDVYLTPEIYDQLRFMRGLEKPGNFWRHYEAMNAVMKKAELGMSPFHYITLGESAIALGTNPLKLAQDVYNSFKVGGAAMLDPKLTQDALKHNLVLSHSADVDTGVIKDLSVALDRAVNVAINQAKQKLMANPTLSKDLHIFDTLLKPGIKVESVMDFTLWKAFQPAIKLQAYEHNVAVALSSGKFKDIPIDVVKRQVSDVINSFAGGQEWGLIFDSPHMQQGLKRALLALDWTASNIRIPLSLPAPDVKGFTARRAYFRMALLFMGITEAASMLNKKVQGEANWMRGSYGNDKGHKFDMWLYRDAKGMSHYATINKGFVEPFRWLTDPLKEAAHKANPYFATIIEQMSGHSLTGYDLQFNRPSTVDGEAPFVHPQGREKALAKKFTPFATGDNSFAGALPVSKAISITNLKSQLETALYKHDQATIDSLKATANENGLNAYKFNRLKKEIIYEIKGREKYEQKGAEMPGANYIRAMTGFSLSDVNEKGRARLQSLLDRLKNNERKSSDR